MNGSLRWFPPVFSTRRPTRLRCRCPPGRRILPGRGGHSRLCRREPCLDQVHLGTEGSRTTAQEFHLRPGPRAERSGRRARHLQVFSARSHIGAPQAPRIGFLCQRTGALLQRRNPRSFDHPPQCALSGDGTASDSNAGEPGRNDCQPIGTAQDAQDPGREWAAALPGCPKS